jgi:hypothetical protein
MVSGLLNNTALRAIVIASVLIGSILSGAPRCYGSDLVFIRSNQDISVAQREMQVAADFYGVDLRVVTASSKADAPAIRAAIEDKESIGVAIDADALPVIARDELLRSLSRSPGNGIPLFVLGIKQDLSQGLAQSWLGRDAIQCARFESSPDSRIAFNHMNGVTEQLGGLEIVYAAQKSFYYASVDSGASQPVESVLGGGKTRPVFVKNVIGRQIVFQACDTPDRDNNAEGQDIVGAFLEIAPAMIFTRYAAGEHGWHALHYYANFTIDDPWLREPYGYVDYKGLLVEMEKHNFHTTIAFIPWNYERSQADVVSLFLNHPNRFSIAVHGNDHDHKEFTDCRTKPLAEQIGDMRQAVARMERFQNLTSVPYDKVMIFPHSIAPAQTLGALKTYNYLATVNSSNIPQDAKKTANTSDVLRPVVLSFDAFPSISRYPAGIGVPEAYVGINQFLGNPLFFYDHSDLFSRGINAFDQIADEVNRHEPATEWRNLGEIVRHYYVEKLRDDSNYDVQAFSNSISLENNAGRDVTFFVRKQETGSQKIASVTVDGKMYPYSFQEGQIRLAVPVKAGAASSISIQFANDLRVASIDVSHDSFVVFLLRMGSDFRDIYLAKSPMGLAVIRFYNEHEVKPAEAVACLVVLLAALVYLAHRLYRVVRKRSASNQSRPYSLVN